MVCKIRAALKLQHRCRLKNAVDDACAIVAGPHEGGVQEAIPHHSHVCHSPRIFPPSQQTTHTTTLNAPWIGSPTNAQHKGACSTWIGTANSPTVYTHLPSTDSHRIQSMESADIELSSRARCAMVRASQAQMLDYSCVSPAKSHASPVHEISVISSPRIGALWPHLTCTHCKRQPQQGEIAAGFGASKLCETCSLYCAHGVEPWPVCPRSLSSPKLATWDMEACPTSPLPYFPSSWQSPGGGQRYASYQNSSICNTALAEESQGGVRMHEACMQIQSSNNSYVGFQHRSALERLQERLRMNA